MSGSNQATYGAVTGGSASLSQEFDFAGQQTDATPAVPAGAVLRPGDGDVLEQGSP